MIKALRDDGWNVIGIREVFENDAQDTSDEEWVAYAGEHGMAGLTCDKRMMRQSSYRNSTVTIFALSNNELRIAEQVRRLLNNRERIFSAARNRHEFWLLYEHRMVRRDPST